MTTPTRTALLLGTLALLAASCSRGAAADAPYVPRDGDLIFQVSRSPQSAAVEAATNSPYTHMGVVFVRNARPAVLEAVEPVRWSPLPQWVRRGRGKHYVVKRLRDADIVLTSEAVTRLRTEGERQLRKHYDTLFGWTDDRWYCSELAWKMYSRALNIDIGTPQQWSELNLSHAAVQKLIKRRRADPNAAERVITPRAMMDSPLLTEVGRWGAEP